MSVESDIRAVLMMVGNLAVPVDVLAADADLFDAGLSSQAAVELVFALEDRCGVAIPDELITRSALGSITALVATVQTASGAA